MKNRNYTSVKVGTLSLHYEYGYRTGYTSIKISQRTSEGRCKPALHIWLDDGTCKSNFLPSEDITPQQFNILRILRGSHPTTIIYSADTGKECSTR